MSTLHTNDALGSAMRLIDMGAEPYLVASSLVGVLAQRLIRRVCPNCGTEHQISEQDRLYLTALLDEGETLPEKFVRGEGCYQCGNTGYQGRMGVYEWLELDDACLSALRRADPEAFAQAAHANEMYRPLERCALDFAIEGKTTVDEVLRVSTKLDVAPTNTLIDDELNDALNDELDMSALDAEI
jgi:MSHA biogenesis protein MshE